MDFDLDDGDDDDVKAGVPAWMATFADLATLLMCFFVLLLSFAEMDVVEFKEMLGSIHESFGVQIEESGHIEALSTTPIEFSDHESSPLIPLSTTEAGAVRSIQHFLRNRNLNKDVEVVTSGQGIVVRLKDRLLFDPGSATLIDGLSPLFDKLREMAEAFPRGLSIEGHTDDVPIQTSRFPSNWELSAARAAAVLRHMERDGPLEVKRLRVTGYADTQALESNETPEGRAKNRRVEFVFDRPTERSAQPGPVGPIVL